MLIQDQLANRALSVCDSVSGCSSAGSINKLPLTSDKPVSHASKEKLDKSFLFIPPKSENVSQINPVPKPDRDTSLEQASRRNNFGTAPCHHSNQGSDSIKFKDLPNFNGTLEGIHPKEFISELEAFYSSSRKSDQTKLFEVGRLFKGGAREWFKVNQNRNKFASFDDFKDEFLKIFWGPEIQSSVFDTFISPNQPAPNYGNLSNYFLSRVRNMQYLDVPAPEAYVIAPIVNQLPYDVRSAIMQAKANTLDSVLTILRGFDQLGSRQKPSGSSSQSQPKTFDTNRSAQQSNTNQNAFANKNIRLTETNFANGEQSFSSESLN